MVRELLLCKALQEEEMAQTPTKMPLLSRRVDVMPRPGDTYKNPGGDQPLYRHVKRNQGPYFNISVTLDELSMRIVNRWPRGTKSERIRLAIKDYANGQSDGVHEHLDELYVNIARLQRALGEKTARITELESKLYTISPGLRYSGSFLCRCLHRLTSLLRMPKDND